MKTMLAVSAAMIGVAAMADGAKYEPTWESLEASYKTPEWYENAKFGIFCHWGMQCVPEYGDWYARGMYEPGSNKYKFHLQHYGDPKEFGAKDLIPLWKADNWDPQELCALYKKMGAKFIVAMANHHDNFDNWDSAYQPWNSVNMGPKKDILKGWADAARANGLRFGASFHAAHAWTWYEPSQNYDGNITQEEGKGKWWEGYDPQMLYRQRHERSADPDDGRAIHRQWHWGAGAARPSDDFMENFRLRTMDAIAKYKPDLIYFDDTAVPFWGVQGLSPHPGLRIVADFYNGNPEGVACGKILDENQRKGMVWDVERGSPPSPMFPKWQTDTCIGGWHYRRALFEREDGYKSAAKVLQMLCDIVSKNGNLCLSIPIRADGSIDAKERAICEEIAAWMAANGEAIFPTVPWEVCGEGPQLAAATPLSAQGFNEKKMPAATKDDFRYLATKDGKTVYAICLVPPADGETPEFPALKGRISAISRLPQVGDCPAVFKVSL